MIGVFREANKKHVRICWEKESWGGGQAVNEEKFLMLRIQYLSTVMVSVVLQNKIQYVMYSIVRNSRLYSTPSKFVSPYLSRRQLSVSSCKMVKQDENFTFDWNKVR